MPKITKSRVTAFTIATVALMSIFSSAKAYAHGGAEIPLSEQDIEVCVAKAKDLFRRQVGGWFLERSTGIDTVLSEDGDELEIRIRYVWGREKYSRYFCGYIYEGRLEVDRAFSGPGVLP